MNSPPNGARVVPEHESDTEPPEQLRGELPTRAAVPVDEAGDFRAVLPELLSEAGVVPTPAIHFGPQHGEGGGRSCAEPRPAARFIHA